jgi:hypothetical protein
MGEVIRDENVKNECRNQPEKSNKWRGSGQNNNFGLRAGQPHPIARIEEKAYGRHAGHDNTNDSKEQKCHYDCEASHSGDYTAAKQSSQFRAYHRLSVNYYLINSGAGCLCGRTGLQTEGRLLVTDGF